MSRVTKLDWDCQRNDCVKRTLERTIHDVESVTANERRELLAHLEREERSAEAARQIRYPTRR